MKRLLFILLAMLLFAGQSHAQLDPSNLLGDYTMTGFKLQYSGHPVITDKETISFKGRLSMTMEGFVAEMSGTLNAQYQSQFIYQWYCGFYSVSGPSTLYATITGESPSYITAEYLNGILTTSGYQYDQDGTRYWLEATWMKKKTYYTTEGYTQAQLDQAVAAAIAEKNNIISTMFTQDQIDQAVAQANAAKDTIISSKDELISTMFTKVQLDLAVAEANDAKDNVIAAKDNIISQLSDIDGDGKTELKDIIWGLKVLSGEK